MHRLADPGPFNVDLMAHSVRKMFDPALPVTSEYLDDAGLTMMMGLVQVSVYKACLMLCTCVTYGRHGKQSTMQQAGMR